MLRLDETKTSISMARVGLNTTTLSEKSGVSRQTISYALAGKKIRPDKAFAIAKALDLDVTEILED